MSELAANVSQFVLIVNSVEFLVSEFEAAEEISTLYRIDLDLALKTEDDDSARLSDMVGQPALLKIFGDPDDRFFHGIVSEFRQTEKKGRFFTYRACIVPQIYLLSLRQDCRIFQEKSVPDIVEQVLSDAGIPGDTFEFRLQGSYENREYCVQYREKDLDFISRLLEEEGIFYFFEHTEEKATLVFGDGAVNYVPIPAETTKLEFHPEGGLAPETAYIHVFEKTCRLHSGKIVLRDCNFLKPSMDLTCQQAESGDSANLGIFDYPGQYIDMNKGGNLAQVRLQAAGTFKEQVEGKGNCPYFTPGHLFDLVEHDRDELNAQYLLVKVHHQGAQPGVLDELAATDVVGGYKNEFLAIPSETTFRPPQRTPKARVEGLQTAQVVGPDGEEIYCDKHGRVKVWFRWDHADEDIEKRSCWIRVCQIMAGAGWGGMWIPRIGHEVVVDFLEGNPDRPLIIGQVFNGANTPPYGLPDEKTKSTIKSSSSLGGDGFNEIRFEDKAGEEQIFVHAQNSYDQKIKGSRRESVGGSRHLTVKKKKLEKIEEDKHLKVTGNIKEQVGGTKSVSVSSNILEKAGMRYALDAAQEIHLNSTMKVVVEAGLTITLKGPGGFIKIDPGGVTIQGTLVKINSGGSPDSGSGCSPDTPDDPDGASGDPGGQAAPPTPHVITATNLSPQAQAMQSASESGTPFCEACEAARQAQNQSESSPGSGT
jgi:type VI secretion system secreted protein VgrG